MSLNNPDVLPGINQFVLSEFSEIKVLQLHSRVVNLTRLFVEASAILEHGLNIHPPVSHIHVPTLLDFFFDGVQVHWVQDLAQIVLEILLSAEVLRSDGVQECLRLLVVPEVTGDIP